MSALAIGETEIPCRSGGTAPDMVRIRAYTVPRWRGLMIHRTPVDDDRTGGRTYSHLWFTVSHATSGLAVMKFIQGIGNAVMVAESLAQLGDWTRTAREVAADEEFCNAARLKLFAFECCGIRAEGSA